MSLGWGKVSPNEWKKLASGGRQDYVPAADYFGTPIELVHFEPSERSELGRFIIRWNTTDENEEQYRGLTLETSVSYHPNPESGGNPEGHAKMNEISLGLMASIVDVLGGELVTEADGAVDVVESLRGVVGSGLVALGTVSHREYQGKSYQDYQNFRPASA